MIIVIIEKGKTEMIVNFKLDVGDDVIDYDHDVDYSLNDVKEYISDAWGDEAVDFVEAFDLWDDVLERVEDTGGFKRFLADKYEDEAREAYESSLE